MNEVLPIPLERLKQVAEANVTLAAAASRLVELAGQTEDPVLKAKLFADLREILTSSQAISGAVQVSGQTSLRHR